MSFYLYYKGEYYIIFLSREDFYLKKYRDYKLLYNDKSINHLSMLYKSKVMNMTYQTLIIIYKIFCICNI